MTIIRLVADDLTGALDTSAQFACVAPMLVPLSPQPPYPAGSFALNLSCRDGPQDEAIRATLATITNFQGSDIAFKKIDSLLRGHWAAEVAAIASTRFFRQIVLAPAFPAQGRITRNGRQFVTSGSSAATLVPVDPAAALTLHGAPATLSLDSRAASSNTTPIYLCDAATEPDLADIVSRGQSLPGLTLWCGTAGLAHTLAGGCAPKVSAPQAPHLVIVGTNHPVTRAQVAVATYAHPEWLAFFSADIRSGAQRIETALGQHGRCVVQAELPSGISAEEAALRISEYLAALAPRIPPPSTVTVIGGETFAALCRALQVEELLVLGEASPGVAASQMTSGLWPGVRCFSKSGAFGTSTWLLRHMIT